MSVLDSRGGRGFGKLRGVSGIEGDAHIPTSSGLRWLQI